MPYPNAWINYVWTDILRKEKNSPPFFRLIKRENCISIWLIISSSLYHLDNLVLRQDLLHICQIALMFNSVKEWLWLNEQFPDSWIFWRLCLKCSVISMDITSQNFFLRNFVEQIIVAPGYLALLENNRKWDFDTPQSQRITFFETEKSYYEFHLKFWSIIFVFICIIKCLSFSDKYKKMVHNLKTSFFLYNNCRK